MNLKEFQGKVFKIEQDLGLCEAEIKGVRFWDVSRFFVCTDVFYHLFGYGKAHSQRINKLQKIKTILSLPYSFLFKNPFFIGEVDLLFFGHSRRKKKKNGKYFDIYTDYFVDSSKFSSATIESFFQQKHLKPAQTENLFYEEFLRTLISLYSFVLKLFYPKSFSEIQKVSTAFKEEFQSPIKIEEIIRNKLIEFKAGYTVYRTLLKILKPKVLLCVVSYNREALIQAAKDLGIKTAEIQHGTLNQFHFGYSYPENFHQKKYFPDYFFSFGPHWSEGTKLPLPKSKIMNTGFPEFENEANDYKGLEREEGEILFISQGSVGIELSKFAAKLSKALKESSRSERVRYRLHPGEVTDWKVRYPWLNESENIEIVTGLKEPLYASFAKAQHLVGVYSTAMYEGIGFGLNSYIYQMNGAERMEMLVDLGLAKKAISPEDILKSFEQKEALKDHSEALFSRQSKVVFDQAITAIF